MADEVAFLRCLAAEQAPDTWQVLADWLEEHGDPRAELIRLHQSLLAPAPEPTESTHARLWRRLRQLLTAGVRPVMPTVVNSLGMALVLVPPGRFVMGGPPASFEHYGQAGGEDPEEVRPHPVRLTRPFLLARFATTQAEYERLTGKNPSRFPGPDLPVEHLSWAEAAAFCERLSEMPTEKAAGRTYRLPSEAEWEYACRAGTSSLFFWGDTLSTRRARFYRDGGYTTRPTRPVGSYPPNAWGLYEMHGNVWEWCADWFDGRYYHTSPVEDPPGPAAGTHHVLRGGSASVRRFECTSATRGESFFDRPEPHGARFECIGDFGMRVACDFDPGMLEQVGCSSAEGP